MIRLLRMSLAPMTRPASSRSSIVGRSATASASRRQKRATSQVAVSCISWFRPPGKCR